MSREIPEDEILYMTGQNKYQCTGCVWRGSQPDMSDASSVDPDTLAKRHHYLSLCPDCGAPAKIAPITKQEQGR